VDLEQSSDAVRKLESELIDVAKKILRQASDPITAVIRFLHERPEDQSLPGFVIDRVLLATFEEDARIPGLVRILAGQVRHISRRSNVIDILKDKPANERWGSYLIKQHKNVKFEVAKERDKLVLKNLVGLSAIEHGIEVPIEKIVVNPPKLEVTLRLGLLRPQRIIDIA
jgi:hypothetical protein